MKEINIAHMKINEVEELSSVTIGRSLIKSITLVDIKRNQSFGEEKADGTFHRRSYGKIEDSDFWDGIDIHRVWYGPNQL